MFIFLQAAQFHPSPIRRDFKIVSMPVQHLRLHYPQLAIFNHKYGATVTPVIQAVSQGKEHGNLFLAVPRLTFH